MTDSRWIASGTQAVSDNTIEYVCIVGNNAVSTTTEGGNRTENILQQAGTLKNGAVIISANDVSSATPIRLRKKTTTDANPNISVTGNTTGLFEDTTNTQTVSAADEYYWKIAPPSVSGNHSVTVEVLVLTFTPTTTTDTVTYWCNGFNSTGDTNNNVTRWIYMIGYVYSPDSTETISEAVIRSQTTWKNLSCLTITYSKGGASTIKSNINQTLGTQTISVSAAGRTSDTTHSDSLSTGDKIEYETTYFADANNWIKSNLTSEGINTSNIFINTHHPVTNDFGAGQTKYHPLYGFIDGLSTENNAKAAPKVTANWKELTGNVWSNTHTTASTFRSRIDTSSGTTLGSSSNGNQVLSYAASTAGVITDSTNTDAVTADYKLTWSLVSGTGGVFWNRTTTSLIAQSTNYTKTFTIDATLKKNLTKTFTADVTLKKAFTKTFTIDTVLKKNYTKTFTADVTLKKNFTKTFTIDTVLKKLDIPKTFTIDTVLQKLNNLKTFTIDSVLATTGSKTFTIDTVLKKNLTKTFTIDTVLQKLNNLKTFTVDTTLLKAFTKTFTVDTVLLKNLTKTFTIDATLLKNVTKTFTIDAVLKKSYTKALTIDTVLQKNLTKTFTIDSTLLKSFTKQFTIDSVLKKAYTKQFTIDSTLKKAFTKTFTIDTYLESAGSTTKSFTIDAVLRSSRRAGSAIKRIRRKLPPKYPEFIPIELHLPLESAVTVPLRERISVRSFIYKNLRTIISLESSVFRKIIENLPLRSAISQETNTHTALESYISNGNVFYSIPLDGNINRDKMDKIREKLIDLIGEDYETS